MTKQTVVRTRTDRRAWMIVWKNMASSSSKSSENKPANYQSPTSGSELVQRHNAGERYFWDVDIPERTDLRNAILTGATFDRGWLSNIDLRGADLRNVTFRDCNVKCTDFREANLENATFKGCLHEATYFENANLAGVSFTGAYIMGHELDATDMPDSQGRF
jgi:hypothetical protein